jgi:uncharacterized protein YecT (DUF1311 family)
VIARNVLDMLWSESTGRSRIQSMMKVASRVLIGTAIAVLTSNCAWFLEWQQPPEDSPGPIGESPESPAASPVSPAPETPPSTPSPDLAQGSETPVASVPEPAPPATGELLDCSNLQTQAEMSACAATLAQTADDRLNQVYQQVRDRFRGTPQEELLIDAQLAWIDFRDANCAFSSGRFAGGSMAPMIRSTCVAEMTRQRTAELEHFLREGN